MFNSGFEDVRLCLRGDHLHIHDVSDQTFVALPGVMDVIVGGSDDDFPPFCTKEIVARCGGRDVVITFYSVGLIDDVQRILAQQDRSFQPSQSGARRHTRNKGAK